MPLLAQDLHLLLGQAREAEHADLAGDMVPRARSALGLQPVAQALAHLDDPATHRAQVVLPLREQRRVVEHHGRDARAVGGRVRDLRPLEDGELARDVRIRLRGLRSGSRDKVERAGTLAVEPEILRERLGDAQLEAFGDEVADGPGVAGQIAGREALIRAVEEREVVTLANGYGDLLPLVLCRVYARGVVSAGVQEDDGATRGGADAGQHAIDVKALCLGGEVGICCRLEPDVCEDLLVVGPCWRGEIDGRPRLGWIEFRKKQTAQMDRAGAGDRLQGINLFIDSKNTFINRLFPRSEEEKIYNWRFCKAIGGGVG